MTVWENRQARLAAAPLSRTIGAPAARLFPDVRCPLSSDHTRPNGWQWSFRNRSAEGAGCGLTSDQPARHLTRRSLKLARLEAVLLVADGALSFRKLAQFATLADVAEARQLVQELNEKLDRGGAAFRVEKVATGVRMMTRPQFSLWLDRLHNRQARAKLSPPMLETLSIVAYRQPVTRADVEKIRGVQASEMLRQLMERGLVRITGEDDSLGRPFLYGTTRQFLEEYGFGSLNELPMADTLRRQDEPAEAVGVDEDADAAQLVEEQSDDASPDDESFDEAAINDSADDSEESSSEDDEEDWDDEDGYDEEFEEDDDEDADEAA